MNIVQLNKIIKQISSCTELVHSYSDLSPYEYWNDEGVEYGSICFCIKKTRMRNNTAEYTALLYYGDRLLQDGSNKNQIWSDSNEVLQSIVGTVNMNSDGNITISYPYDITHFEQKFADNLAGAYAQLVITVNGIDECGKLVYGYENEPEIKLENVVANYSTNGTYSLRAGQDYDAIEDVKITVSVEPKTEDVFSSIGYSMEDSSLFLGNFSNDIEYSKSIKREWEKNYETVEVQNCNFNSNRQIVYFPAVKFDKVRSTNRSFMYCNNLVSFPKVQCKVSNVQQAFYQCNKLRSLDLSGWDISNVTDMSETFYRCESADYIDVSNWDTSNVTKMSGTFNRTVLLTELDLSNWDTAKVVNVSNMFSESGIKNLNISGWDMSNITNINLFLAGYGDGELENLKFGKNLKINWTSYGSPYRLPKLTTESLLSIIDGLYDFTGNGETPTSSQGQIEFGTTHLNKLTDEQKAVATNKGWILT